MMTSLSKEKFKKADALLVPCWKGGKLAVTDSKLKRHLAPALADFKGGLGETTLVYSGKERVILLGLGSKKTIEAYQQGYAAAVRRALPLKISTINVLLPDDKDATVRAVTDGLLLANDSFDELRKEKTHLIKKIALVGVSSKQLTLARKAKGISEGIHLARKLICRNADDVTPQALCKEARELAKHSTHVKTTIFNRQRIEKEKMGLLLAVARGSEVDPAFIIVEYKGDPKSKEHTVLVGKGVTYDTGGLSLKPTTGMITMRTDMTGAATVLGVIRAAIATHLKANVTAVIAATENGIDGKSYKPGDVYTGYSGKTVEIVNTDAEGRLTLADALAYAEAKLKPTRMIDLATLTGAMVIALGEEVAGFMSDDEKLSKELLHSAEAVGEPLWRLPLHKPYKKLFKSDIADIANCGSRAGSSITAGLFLQEFVKKVSWAHLDIAGVGYPDKATALAPNRATGYGIRTLIHFLETQVATSPSAR